MLLVALVAKNAPADAGRTEVRVGPWAGKVPWKNDSPQSAPAGSHRWGPGRLRSTGKKVGHSGAMHKVLNCPFCWVTNHPQMQLLKKRTLIISQSVWNVEMAELVLQLTDSHKASAKLSVWATVSWRLTKGGVCCQAQHDAVGKNSAPGRL